MEKKIVKVLFKTFAWLAISPFYELKKMCFVERRFHGLCWVRPFVLMVMFVSVLFFVLKGEYFSIHFQ